MQTRTHHPKAQQAFTMVELLAVVVILGILVGLLFPLFSRGQGQADSVKMLSVMKSVGIAMSLYSTDHQGQCVGPLWPGQVALYDRSRSGRLVRELGSYLQVEDRTTPYLVDSFVTGTLRRALSKVAPGDIRVWVMNMAILKETGPINPWGSEAANPRTSPLPASVLHDLPQDTWAMSEAYQAHPAVRNAPWRANTPALPTSGPRPLALFFDGRVQPLAL